MDTLRFVWPYARRCWLKYSIGILIAPISAASSLAIPWLIGRCVEALQADPAVPGLLLGGTRSRGWFPDLGLLPDLIAVALLSGVSLFAVRWLVIGASRDVEFRLRNDLFAHLQRLDQSFYNKARTGDLMSRVTSDVERVRLVLGPIILYSARTACILAVGLALMISLSLTLTFFIMLPLCLMTIAVRIVGPRVHREVLKAQETLADLSSLGQEDFSGIRTLKSYVQEEHEDARFTAVSERYFAENMRAARASSWMPPIVGGIGDLALFALLLFGGAMILDRSLGFGDFVSFAGYQATLMWPMLSIGWVVNQYQRSRASVERLIELFRIQPAVTSPADPVLPPSGRIRGDVSIRGLTFRHGDRVILEGIDLEAPAGSTVAILGRTGSGKSTLVHLLPRMLPVPDGCIFIDGIDVNRLPLDVLRQAIGYVPQESFLFSKSVHDNIAFGQDDAGEREIVAAAQLARFDKDIDQLPRGYDEIVGERGVMLSGGQKQRAALARALLRRPRILILDDAFSAVDTQTEEEILSNLRASTAGVTKIIVSHRVSSIAHADAIYVLDGGRVAERGTHQELLRLGGIYAEVHRLQQISDALASL